MHYELEKHSIFDTISMVIDMITLSLFYDMSAWKQISPIYRHKRAKKCLAICY